MTLQQMRYFIGAAESGSISEAAKRSFTAQSSISGAIKEVENTYQHLPVRRACSRSCIRRSSQSCCLQLL